MTTYDDLRASVQELGAISTTAWSALKLTGTDGAILFCACRNDDPPTAAAMLSLTVEALDTETDALCTAVFGERERRRIA